MSAPRVKEHVRVYVSGKAYGGIVTRVYPPYAVNDPGQKLTALENPRIDAVYVDNAGNTQTLVNIGEKTNNPKSTDVNFYSHWISV